MCSYGVRCVSGEAEEDKGGEKRSAELDCFLALLPLYCSCFDPSKRRDLLSSQTNLSQDVPPCSSSDEARTPPPPPFPTNPFARTLLTYEKVGQSQRSTDSSYVHRPLALKSSKADLVPFSKQFHHFLAFLLRQPPVVLVASSDPSLHSYCPQPVNPAHSALPLPFSVMPPAARLSLPSRRPPSVSVSTVQRGATNFRVQGWDPVLIISQVRPDFFFISSQPPFLETNFSSCRSSPFNPSTISHSPSSFPSSSPSSPIATD